MLSRVANSIYWMSRYIERAENIARFIDAHLQLSLDNAAGENAWKPLIAVTGEDEAFAKQYDSYTRENVLDYLTFDRKAANSIASCVAIARENARTVRDTITSEMWEQINALHIMIKTVASTSQNSYHQEFYKAVKNASLLFAGVTNGTMSHGLGWDFCRLGQMIERTDKTSRILDVKYFLLLPTANDVGTSLDVVQWTALLRSAGALEMYRQRFGVIQPANVAEFLLLDSRFPRSMTFCMIQAEHALAEIEGYKNSANSEPYRVLGRLRSHLQFAEISEIVSSGMHEYLDHVQKCLNEIDDAIHTRFFQFLPPSAEQDHGESAQ